MRTIYRSIKFKLLALSLIVTLILSLIVCFGIYQTMAGNVEKEQILTAGHNLKLAMDNVDQNLFQIYRLVLWCSTSNDVYHFLGGSRQKYTTVPTKISAFNALRAQYFNTPIESYINKLILCTYDDRYVIQGNSFGMEGVNSDIEVCKSLPYFERLLKSDTYEWVGLKPEKFFYAGGNTLSIPILRPVSRSDSNTRNGWIYMAVNPRMITDKIGYYVDAGNSDIYWYIGGLCYLYTPGGLVFKEDGITLKNRRQLTEDVVTADVLIGGKTRRAIVAASSGSDWYAVQTIAPGPSILQVGSLKEVLLPLAFLAAVLLLFTLLLQRMVSRPVKAISRRIQKIGAGDFSCDNAIESADEFGFIGQGINRMAQDISKLMKDRMEAEKVKRELELGLLQSQVNPHFLYNTLNTIKWMAVMQRAQGISEITSALAQMLKKISKGTDLLIPLREELAFLDDYITIQTYRYGGMFSYACQVDGEELYGCRIMRFALQPIVENAIFHGIEPKKQFGKITAEITGEEGVLLIRITDNGVGMSQDTIDRLLSGEENRAGVFRKIGLSNVNQRIQIEYGPEYGISIESELGSYTCVTLRFPMLSGQLPAAGEETGGGENV